MELNEQVKSLLIKDYGINEEGASCIANDVEYINLVFDDHEIDKEVKLVLVDEYGFEEYYADSIISDVKSINSVDNLLEDAGATIEPYCKSLKNNKQVSMGLER